MLSWLRVSGFALIDTVEIPFGPGLTVITGETGAGKSILIDALALLRGGRASAELIRAGRDGAEVEAIFHLPAEPGPLTPLRERLIAEGRYAPGGPDADEGEEDDGLVVRRIVSRAGRGRVQLGGGLATVGELGESIGALVDITSQHDSQSLMDPDSQLAILDVFAENGALLEQARAAYAALSEREADLAGYETAARARAEREDFLRFQLAELDEAALQPGEDDSLKGERERVRGAEKFAAVFGRGDELLSSGDDAAADRLGTVARDLETLAALDPTLAPLGERLRNAQALVEDVASDMSRLASEVRFDPERLAEIEERLHLIGRLVRKHGGSVATVVERREVLAAELAGLGSYEEGLASRRGAVEAARTLMNGFAEALAERRRRSARTLGRKIDETLRDLGLEKASVKLVVEDRGEQGPKGRDRVKFLFAPNPGEEPRPLARIASGGELSRVMLAVKRALAQSDRALTYVFDEIDTGVGGGTAEVIGRKLKAISRDRQVLAVTHLAQIAAFADHHIHVEKEVSGGRTVARFEILTDKKRAIELARMLGGLRPSREASAHADEMLRRARAA
jgi:DNA repair protein RecN (Recombination protein N)